MLCTPPAFILSQDQTLEIIILYLSLAAQLTIFRAIFILASLTCLSIYNSLTRFVFRTYYALYFSLVVQFSMTVRCLFFGSLSIIPHRSSLVNTFFQSFFEFFSTRFSLRLSLASLRQLEYYITLLFECQVFFEIFSLFFAFW